MLLTKAKVLMLPTLGMSLLTGSVLGAACASCAGGRAAHFYQRDHTVYNG